MSKWEYAVVYSSSHPAATQQLNEMGTEGWELVGLLHGWFYMKRPLPDPAEKEMAEVKPKRKRRAPAKKAVKK